MAHASASWSVNTIFAEPPLLNPVFSLPDVSPLPMGGGEKVWFAWLEAGPVRGCTTCGGGDGSRLEAVGSVDISQLQESMEEYLDKY